MDGREADKKLNSGANSAISHADMSDGIYEANHPADIPANKDNAGAPEVPMFHKDGAIGKQFKPDGAIGQIGEKVGGPFASDGAVGKNFTPGGAIGGTIHENLGKKD